MASRCHCRSAVLPEGPWCCCFGLSFARGKPGESIPWCSCVFHGPHGARLFSPSCSLADFSNVISKSDVKSLAEADEQEVVAEVQVSWDCFGSFR